ncbi:hypothetical protein KPH14_008551 [Odynerus spinipes]|uniref:BZIP domain-containing protein n=1 Tax=Odynerus spinipes TaxID=1348599 RepID=A0AAD9RSA9_9HYME|nr:hypothetical protein KPH14_008551 [Odynerus spinipes]
MTGVGVGSKEGVATFIVHGRASKIPPISESLPTSNISFEEGGVNNVPKPCSRLPQPLSASRGVRSRPLEEEVASRAKLETIPLLSPNMESDLLKEPWIFPQTKTIAPVEEDSVTTFPEWEENFQDLSGWCMDPFQGQCDFPIGELAPFKLSGTKYEDKGVLSLEEGVSENARGVNEKKWSPKMNSLGDTALSGSKYHPFLPSTNSTFDCKKELDEAEFNESNAWLKLPRRNNSVTDSKRNTSNVNNVPINSQQRIGNLDLDDSRHSTFESTENNQPLTWDMLNTVQISGSDTFDLLSYLCEDEMPSSSGSTSTEASAIFNSRSPIEQLPTVAQNADNAAEAEMNVDTVRRPVQTRSTSTITPSSETFPVSSRRSERTRTTTSSRVEKRYSTGRREIKKRPVEDTASTRISSFNYRESREKNNEASRKSRMNKKVKETEMALRVIELEKDNRILKMKVEELEKLVTSMRTALLRSALKKES